MKILKEIIFFLISCMVSIAHLFFKMEGVNMFLLFLPAEMLIRTLRCYGAAVGENVDIRAPLIVHNAEENYANLIIGRDCHIGKCVFLDLKDQVKIGDRVILSMGVTLLTHMHAGRSRLSSVFPPTHSPVRIEADAYLGANVTVLQGIHIGESSLTGAGSIVLKNVPANTVVAGNPAKVIRKLN